MLIKYKMTSGYIANYTYDGFDRLTKVSVDTNSPIDTSYTYYESKMCAPYRYGVYNNKVRIFKIY